MSWDPVDQGVIISMLYDYVRNDPMHSSDFHGLCQVGEVRNLAVVYEMATNQDNGINLEAAYQLSEKMTALGNLSSGASLAMAIPSVGISGLIQLVATATDVTADQLISNCADKERAIERINQMNQKLVAAYPKVRGRLIFEECKCRLFFFNYWSKETLGPTKYIDVVGGTHINGAFGSFPSLDTAKGMIQKELMGMVGER